jgi:hypothetical protein
MLLQGMIKRDPATRLGAWENPPQDIMSAPFFGGIEWDAIYERRFDGPYVPEIQHFGGSGRSKSRGDLAAANGEKAARRAASAADGTGDAEEEDDEEEEDDYDSGSEMKGMRDSVFIRPHDGAGNNLLDWSFIDEKVLAETCKSGEAAGAKKKKKKGTGKKKGADAATLSASAAEQLKISEEIENKVCFAPPSGAASSITAPATNSDAVVSVHADTAPGPQGLPATADADAGPEAEAEAAGEAPLSSVAVTVTANAERASSNAMPDAESEPAAASDQTTPVA